MWHTRLVWLLLLFAGLFSVSLSHAEEPILIYQSELDELTMILTNLEKQNQELQTELEQSKTDLQTVLQQLAEWETKYNGLRTSWTEYENAVNQEVALLDRELHKKNIFLGLLGGASVFLLGTTIVLWTK